MNLLLYLTTVLIWGTTWIAIKWQTGVVAPPVSIAFRFILASIVMLAIVRLMRRPMRPPRAAALNEPASTTAAKTTRRFRLMSRKSDMGIV
jgi:drug/metabolite transporter (DMT)-like permease